jgi:hypothetical protein
MRWASPQLAGNLLCSRYRAPTHLHTPPPHTNSSFANMFGVLATVTPTLGTFTLLEPPCV